MNDLYETTNDLAIFIQNLSVTLYAEDEEIHAVRNLALSLRRGEILAIVGESGSGKTMVCRSIMGLLPKTAKITSGSIVVEGKEISKMSESQLCTLRGDVMSMVFQDPMTSLDPTMTIGKQIGNVMRVHKKMKDRQAIKKRVIELMEIVGIDRAQERYAQYPWQLSGGMRQRCVIAAALSCSPKVLIADEPTTALDVTVQANILKIISDIRDKLGVSILFITHDLGVVAGIADRVAIMQNGEIVECGNAADIYENPKHEYTRQLMDALPANAQKPEISAFLEDKNILDVKSVSHYFKLGRKDFISAVNDVSFSVKKGEIFSIVGESGSGKSTLARCVLGMYEPTAGEICYDGITLNPKGRGIPGDEKRRISKEVRIISQDSAAALNPHMTVREVIAEPLNIHNMFKTKRQMNEYIEEMLDEVGLSRSLMERPVTMLSGGQRQRVSIARAFASQPKLLVADEPLASLDVTMQMQIVQLFLHLIREHDASMLFIAHDLSMVRFLSTRVGVMYKGELVEVGDTEEIFNNPKHPYTKSLIDAMPLPNPEREKEKLRLLKEGA